MAAVTAAAQAVERALDAAAPWTLERAHLYFDVESRDKLEELAAELIGGGFEVVRQTGRRYDYKDSAWFWQAELALAGVGAYVRAPA